MIAAVAALFVLAMAGLLWQVFSLSDNLSRGLALQGTELQSVMLEEFRKYYSSQVVARIQGIGGAAVTHDYVTTPNAIPLPATMTIELAKRIGGMTQGFQVRLYSDYPYPWRNESGPRDAFEKEALQWLRQHPDQPFYRFEQIGSDRVLRYAKADRMETSCLACHNSDPASPKKDWREGDVRGVLEVVRPVSEGASPIYGQLQQTFLLLGVVGVVGLSGLTLAVARMRRGTKVLEHLVNERTAELAAATQRANQTAQDKAQILSTVDAFFIRVDASGAVCEWTNQAENLFGIPLPEVFGRTFREASISWDWGPSSTPSTGRSTHCRRFIWAKFPFAHTKIGNGSSS